MSSGIHTVPVSAWQVLCNWFLVAIPTLGITGASYATVADIGV